MKRCWWSTKPWTVPGLVIRHRQSGDYVVMDMEDFASPTWAESKRALLDSHCRLYLKAQFRPDLCVRPPYDRMRPWIYGVYDAFETEKHLERLRRMERTVTGLFFRGKTDYTNRSEIMTCLREMGLAGLSDEFVPIPVYLEEMSRYRLALALPGHGNLCHREFEAFGVGTPVLMPRLKNALHEPLIPDHHYFSVDAEPEDQGPQLVAERIRARYDQVIANRAAREAPRPAPRRDRGGCPWVRRPSLSRHPTPAGVASGRLRRAPDLLPHGVIGRKPAKELFSRASTATRP